VISVLSRLTLLVVLIGAAIAPNVQQVAGQEAATPAAEDLVQPSECTVEPRTAYEVYALIDTVLADDKPPTSSSGTVEVDDDGLTADIPMSLSPVDVSLDGTHWIKEGTVAHGAGAEQAGQPVDPTTAANIKSFLRTTRACYNLFVQAPLRSMALYTDLGLEQYFRLNRRSLRGLASLIETTSLVPGEEPLGPTHPEYRTIDMRLLSDNRVAIFLSGTEQFRDEPIYPWLYVLAPVAGQWKIDWMHHGQFAPIGKPGATPVSREDAAPTPLPTQTTTPISEDPDSKSACPVKPRNPDEMYAFIDTVIADKQPPASADGGIEVDAGTIGADNPRESSAPDVRLDGALWIENGLIIDGSNLAPVDALTDVEIRTAVDQLFACGYPYWYAPTFSLYTNRGLDQYLRFERPILRNLASYIDSASNNTDMNGPTSPSEHQVLDMQLLSDGRVAVVISETDEDAYHKPSELPWLIVLAKSEGQWKIDWVFYGEFAPPEGTEITPVP
jgi:hypothetical protein